MWTTGDAQCFLKKLQGQNLDESNPEQGQSEEKQCQLISGEEEPQRSPLYKNRDGTLMSKMKMTKRIKIWARRVMI